MKSEGSFGCSEHEMVEFKILREMDQEMDQVRQIVASEPWEQNSSGLGIYLSADGLPRRNMETLILPYPWAQGRICMRKALPTEKKD